MLTRMARACGCCGGTPSECGYNCNTCTGHKLPLFLYITDDNGTWLAGPAFVNGLGNAAWNASGYKSISNSALDNGPCGTSSTVNTQYILTLQCYTDGSGFRLSRLYFTQQSGADCCDGNGGRALKYRSTILSTNACFHDTQTPKFTPADCTNVSYSGTLAKVTTQPDDPFGTSVSVAFTASYGRCQAFTVTGCNGLPLQGATVNVRASAGGAILATGTTSADGYAYCVWSGSATVYVEVIMSRFTTYGATLTIGSAGMTTVSLSADTGYHCIAGCALPLADTLYCTWTNAGAVTMTYSAGVWASTFVYSGVTYTANISTSAVLTMTYDPGGGALTCTGRSMSINACPPSLSIALNPGASCTAVGTGTVTE